MKLRLRARVLIVLTAVAALPIVLSLLLHDRALSRDLEQAAGRRVENAARVVDQLVEQHLAAMLRRYESIAGTPQFKANLEVDDPPTLAHFAEGLRERHGAARILFLKSGSRLSAAAGDDSLDSLAQAVERAGLVARRGQPYAVVSVPIESDGLELGRLVAVEPLRAATIDAWSQLSGAKVRVSSGASAGPDDVVAHVRDMGPLGMDVVSTLRDERRTLLRSRSNLLRAGGAGLLLAILASLALSRWLTAPIERLRQVAREIGAGDLQARVGIRRGDELGDLAMAVDEMARTLGDQRAQLTREKDRAQQASEAKSQFLANVSHELRTPLTPILGFSEALEESPHLDAEEREWITTARRNAGHLLELLDDLLDISRIEAGRITVEKRVCPLRAVVGGVSDLLRGSAEAKAIDLQVDLPPDLPEMIETDPMRLRQVLANLVGNAIKFTDEGGRVRLALRRDAGPGARAAIAFEVSDTGVGIHAEHLARVFEPFSQVDSSSSRRFGGAGLGLAIAKGLVELLGGAIAVESEPGRGTVFRFTIDAGQATPPPPSRDGGRQAPVRPRPQTKSGTRVLLAEDSPDNQRLLCMILRKADIEVDVVENGADAVERALCALESDAPYDLILMDMQMPVLDGYSATTQLRARAYGGVIIALTAHAMDGDRQKCLNAGCDDFVAKPVTRAGLLQVIARYAPRKRPS